MRRLLAVPVLLAVCLAGCSANKDFEKDILGHPVGDANGSWAQQHTPPPPPPPVTTQATSPPPVPAPATILPVSPVVQQPAPAVVAVQPAPAPRSYATSSPSQPALMGRRHPHYSFQVGAFAHSQNAKHLAAKLESRGFRVRVEEGHTSKRPFYTVFASKAGSRASLEGELFACGVTEPILTGMQPAQRPGPAAAPASTVEPGPAPAKTFATSSHRGQGGSQASHPGVAAQPRQPQAAPGQVRYAPPKVEPAPPLPDGYVPPPKAASAS